MATYTVEERGFDIPEHALILDTNILVASFDSDDAHHKTIREFIALAEDEYTLVVPSFVVVETWGLLVGRAGKRSSGLALIEWLCSSTTLVILPDSCDSLPDVHSLANNLEIDAVDALLFLLADQIGSHCSFSGPVPIATLDKRDFYKKILGRFRSRLLDPITFELVESSAPALLRATKEKVRTRRRNRVKQKGS